MDTAKDEVMPDGEWEFDQSVTDVFDDMLERSIPQYDIVRALCTRLAIEFAKPGTDIVDLGCSRGGALAPIIDSLGARCRYIGIEVSPSMLAAARERFQGYIETSIVDIREMDLRKEYPSVRSSVTISFLTLQFTPIEYRPRIIESIYNNLEPGGAFILVEKVLGLSGAIDKTLVDIYLEMKRANGYSDDQIQRKALSLEGKLVPITAAWNESMLLTAGFTKVECFWRWINFGGWLAIK